MPGKDVVNVIKATMEWVDVPIVLYTRIPIESQKEARTTTAPTSWCRAGPGARTCWWRGSSPSSARADWRTT